MADIITQKHLWFLEAGSCREKPGVFPFQRIPKDRVVKDPQQFRNIHVAFVAKHGKAVILALQQASLRGNAVQASGMLTVYMRILNSFVQTKAIGRLCQLRKAGSDQIFYRFCRNRLPAVNHALIGQTLIIAGHIVCRTLYTGAGTKRRQHRPFLVSDDFFRVILILLKQCRDVAIRSNFPCL